jgi:hypothetical protein
MALDGVQRMNQLAYRQPRHVEKPKHSYNHEVHPLPQTAETVELATYRKQPDSRMANKCE